jgi:nicotinamidase/pyrazinamidase
MTVFFDIDTQIDFLFPAGALYVPGAETILDRVAALNRLAASRGIPVISTMDAHAEDDPEFRVYPHHCVAGTDGQRKPAATLVENRVVVPNAPSDRSAAQILLEKQQLDCFTNVNLPSILDRLKANRYFVYGVVTEICVKCAAFGLLKRGGRVTLVSDAVRALNDDAASRMIAEFCASGGELMTAAEVRELVDGEDQVCR